MDVVTCAELAGVVVTPCEHVVTRIKCSDEATSHIDVHQWMRKLSLRRGSVLAARVHRCPLGHEPDESRQSLVSLQEAVRCPGAKGPAPRKDLGATIDHSHVGLIACYQMRDVFRLECLDPLELLHCILSIIES